MPGPPQAILRSKSEIGTLGPTSTCSGRWTATATQPSFSVSSTWISFQLEDSYVYDPTSGDDFIIQIRSCAPTTPWGLSIDAVSGLPGALGGNRYGPNSDCAATAQNFNNNVFVPVVKISYVENRVATLPYVENFDNYGAQHLGKKLPPGWSGAVAIRMAGAPIDPVPAPGTAPGDHTTGKVGAGHFLTTDDGSSFAVAEVILSPWIDLGGVTSPIANFWVFSDSPLPATILDQNRLVVSVERKVGNGFQGTLAPKQNIQLLGHGCWTRFALDLSPFAGDVVRLRFSASTDSADFSMHGIAIDDFSIFLPVPEEGGQSPQLDRNLDINNART